MNPGTSGDPGIDLLVARALEGLSPAQRDDLRRALDAAPETDPDALDRAAAVLDQALSPPSDALPDRVRAKLLAAADAWVAGD